MQDPWLNRFAVFTAVCTLGLIFAGGLVTSTGSGLAVPDWPLSYGQLMPPMVGGVFYEHGHRMIAATVGFLTLILACWIFAKEPRRWVGWLAACALSAVVLQGVLGGLTVLLLLPPAVSVAHACLAQAFLCLTVTLAVVTGRKWEAPTTEAIGLRWPAIALTVAVYLQLILGAVMRHTGAGLAIPDFPLAMGRVIPPFDTSGVAIHFAHRVWAVCVLLLGSWTAVSVLRRHRDATLRRPAWAILILLPAQITLGALTVLTGKQVLPTTAHVACGAALLAASLVLTLRVARGGNARRVLDFVSLTKPRVVVMILLTTAVGFLMGRTGPFTASAFLLLAQTLIGTALVAGGTLALNQYMERGIDALMKRTSKRPLPDGRMKPDEALFFGGTMTTGGLLYLSLMVNPVSAMVTALTVITYLFMYTPLKTRTALCTIVGAFPGALPPLTGWTAAGAELGVGAGILFAILFLWQLPHSLAIAHLYREDYDRAGVRLLPTVDWGGASTGRQTVLNALALMAVGLLPLFTGMAGWLYAVAAISLGGLVLWQGVALAVVASSQRARRLLIATYLYIPIVLLTMLIDRTPS